jgi:DNA modification methylase
MLTSPVLEYDQRNVQLWQGDCLHHLWDIPTNSIDSIATDPPAGIAFMGKGWDKNRGGRTQWVAWLTERMEEAYRVLKPGGHALVWALPRTSHWTALALEDAGFEIRDCITHLFGTGFPKSLDIGKAIDKAAGVERKIIGNRTYADGTIGHWSPNDTYAQDTYTKSLISGTLKLDTAPATNAAKQWDGWGTALKPASEHWWLVRKPFNGAVAATVLEHGTGALNIDACRINPGAIVRGGGNGTANVGGIMGPKTGIRPLVKPHTDGRWPSNVVLSHASTPDGYDACADGCVDGCPVAELDHQSGNKPVGGSVNGNEPSNPVKDVYFPSFKRRPWIPYPDSGGASRFFPTFRYQAKAPTSERPKIDDKSHSTVKSLALMRWLVRLITPPGGTVLDMFAGSGSTGEAARAEGMLAILIDNDPDSIAWSIQRLERPASLPA